MTNLTNRVNICGYESGALIAAAIRLCVLYRVCVCSPTKQPKVKTKESLSSQKPKRIQVLSQGLTWKKLNQIRIVMEKNFIRLCLFPSWHLQQITSYEDPLRRLQCLSITLNANMRLCWPPSGFLRPTHERNPSLSNVFLLTSLQQQVDDEKKVRKINLSGASEKRFFRSLKSFNNFLPL